METKQHQLFLETMAFTDACSTKQTQLDKHIDNEQEYNLGYAQDVINKILPIAEAYIENLYTLYNLHTKKYYWELIKPQHEKAVMDKLNKVPSHLREWEPSKKIAEIVCVLLTQNLSKGTTLTYVVEAITKSASQHFGIPFMDRDEWRPHGINFFTPLVQHIAENTDIFSVEQNQGVEYRLYLSEEWEAKVKEFRDNWALNVSNFKPMVHPPLPHADLVSGDGGYLKSPSPLLKKPVKHNGQVHPNILNFNAETQPEWFASINRAQATPYRINEKLFAMIEAYYSDDITFKKFPKAVNEINAFKAATKEIEKRNAKRLKFQGEEFKPLTDKTVALVVKKHNNNEVESVRRTNAMFQQVRFYNKFPAIYFPIFCDYRGRRYPYANSGLSFQGDEMAKALLQFADRYILTEEGVSALFETLGNVIKPIGDKMLVEKKEALARIWFEANKETFLNGDYSMFFLDSHIDEDDKNETRKQMFDEPITALAIVLELIGYYTDTTGEFHSSFICHRDARCSGASIIGTVMRDKDVMEMTSVLDWNNEGKLGDAYTAAALKALALCEADAKKGCEFALDLLDFETKLFTRKMFKDPVMITTAYGGTEYGMREHNKNKFDWEKEGLTRDHKNKFDTLMMKSLNQALPSCGVYLKAAKEAAKQATAGDKDIITFNNPITHFPVVHKEYKMKSRPISIVFNHERIRLKIMEPAMKEIKNKDGTKRKVVSVNKMGMVNATAPNIIHSLDSALLSLVERQLGFELSLIHDSLGASANNVRQVVEAYSKATMVLANNNLFNIIFDEMGTDVKVERTDTLDVEMGISRHCLV